MKQIKYYNIKKVPCKINRKELKIGMRIEKEHTTNKKIAKAIAIAHICEFPNYYSKGLVPMELKLKRMKRRLIGLRY